MLTELGLYKLFGEDPEKAQRFARSFMGTVAMALAPSATYGVERVPDTGGLVVASNHLSAIDPVLVPILCPRTIYQLAKIELLEVPIAGEVLRWLGSFAVRRGEGDRDALRVARWVASEGHAVGFFVEGTRRKLGYPGPGHAGAAMIAIQEGVPVVPCGLDTFQWSLRNPRRCAIVWGDPIDLSGLPRSGKGYKEGAAIVDEAILGLWRQAARGRRRRPSQDAPRRLTAPRAAQRYAGQVHRRAAVAGRGVGPGAARACLPRPRLMEIAPAASLRGALRVPGDKSISHRALLVGAVGEGETVVRGFGRSLDTESTLAAVRSLGVAVAEEAPDVLRVSGVGLAGLQEPGAPIDCGNAGTLARLLPGLLAGQAGRRFELTGDESLRARPMERVALPLSEMGAHVETSEGRLPLTIEGRELAGIEHEPAVASAQVKSCVLLAGLLAEGRTTVVEPVPTRDHTERMLRAAGAKVATKGSRISVERAERLDLGEVDVPGDLSAAAPFIVAATLLPGSELILQGVGVNPTRTGLLDALERMGARISVFNRRSESGEPVADLEVTHAELVATEIVPAEVPRMIDELPLFALAASMARGTSRVRGAAELRAKESDRIDTVAAALRAVGARATPTDDGFAVRGVPTRPRGGAVSAAGDHRLAMLAAVAGLVSKEGVQIEGADAAAVSFPGFYELLDSLAHR